jgi:hypothetical protein
MRPDFLLPPSARRAAAGAGQSQPGFQFRQVIAIRTIIAGSLRPDKRLPVGQAEYQVVLVTHQDRMLLKQLVDLFGWRHKTALLLRQNRQGSPRSPFEHLPLGAVGRHHWRVAYRSRE